MRKKLIITAIIGFNINWRKQLQEIVLNNKLFLRKKTRECLLKKEEHISNEKRSKIIKMKKKKIIQAI
ncbi:hypothetical protein ACSXE3_15110 (plasmid) [Clostridium perfringens]